MTGIRLRPQNPGPPIAGLDQPARPNLVRNGRPLPGDPATPSLGIEPLSDRRKRSSASIATLLGEPTSARNTLG